MNDTKLDFMVEFCDRHKLELRLDGEVGFGRECVGVICSETDSYPAYEEWNEPRGLDDPRVRLDANGEVWIPERAYHKGPYVAVLGRDADSREQLYQWLKWFDSNGFVLKLKKRESKDPVDLLFHGRFDAFLCRKETKLNREP